MSSSHTEEEVTFFVTGSRKDTPFANGASCSVPPLAKPDNPEYFGSLVLEKKGTLGRGAVTVAVAELRSEGGM
jgi:hypothetical protein